MIKFFFRHQIKVIVFVLLVLCIGLFAIFTLFKSSTEPEEVAEPVIEAVVPEETRTVETIGTSVLGRTIEAYSSGNGDTRLLFVGGIHGGYEWNSVVLAYEFIDYLESNPEAVPENLTISVIPSANPDGVYKVIQKEGRFSAADVPNDTGAVGTGRFNANDVDLNRNFDCKWAPESSWRGNIVSAGTGAFSEPEAVAVRDFVLTENPKAVVFWHSKSDAVYASECEDGVLPETLDIMNAYSGASGYKPVESFDAYPITGDAEGWLASIGIPAITVELKTHETVEWEENLAGIEALFEFYSTK